MAKEFGSLEASIQEKLEADTDFNASLDTLSDDEKEQAIDAKKTEIYESELTDLKTKAERTAKAEEIAENQKKRAEKAESKNGKEPKEPSESKDLSSLDTIALVRAEVHEDDIPEVVEYAKFKKISITEALKTSVIKSSLAEKAEFRKTAEATNAGKNHRTVNKVDGDTLVKNLHEKGEVPEKGSKEAEELFWAKRGGQKK